MAGGPQSGVVCPSVASPSWAATSASNSVYTSKHARGRTAAGSACAPLGRTAFARLDRRPPPSPSNSKFHPGDGCSTRQWQRATKKRGVFAVGWNLEVEFDHAASRSSSGKLQFYDCCTDDFLLAVACESAAQQSKNWTNVTNLDNFPMLVHDALPMKASMLAYLLAPSHTLAVKAVGV